MPIATVDGGLVFERDWNVARHDVPADARAARVLRLRPVPRPEQAAEFRHGAGRLQLRPALQRQPLPRQRPHRRRQPAHARADVAAARAGDRRRAAARRRRPALLLPGPAGRCGTKRRRRPARRTCWRWREGRLSDAWAIAGLWQYNFDSSQTERFNAGVRYTPAPGRVLNASYRYDRQYVDPIGGHRSCSSSSTSRRSGRSRRTGRCSGGGTTRSPTARRWRRWRASSTMPTAGRCGSSASA